MELQDHKDIVRDLSFSANGSLLFASCSMDGTVKLWDLADDGNMKKTLKSYSRHLHSCKWSPDSKKIAAVGSNKLVGCK